MEHSRVNTVLSRTMLSALAVFMTVAISAPSARAQLITGTITGTVRDQSNAAIAGAEITLSNTQTGVVRQTKTDDVGGFRFLLLPSGVYAIQAVSPGFKSFRRDGVVVEVDRSQAIPIRLDVGQLTERVEVTAGTPLLEPNTSSLGTVMDRQKVEDLPLNGRNPFALANLIPTVRGIGYFGGPVLTTFRAAAVSIGGGPLLSTAFLLDGTANENIGTAGGALFYLPIDATQEFKIQTNTLSAEYGRSGGGIISVISKSGTNDFHGNLSEFLRNTAFNSNTFFSNKAGQTRSPMKVNQFAAALGGPIRRDKLFFFVNYEGYRERQPGQTTMTSPSALERAGDFSETRNSAGNLINVYDPTTTRQDPTNPGRYIRDTFPNGQIPASRINPVAAAVLKYYPLGNLSGLPYTHAQNLYLATSAAIDKDSVGVKVDYNLSSARRVAARYTYYNTDWGYPNYFNNIADSGGQHILIPRHSLSFQYTDVLTPALLLDFKAGVNRSFQMVATPSEGFDITSIGLPASLAKTAQNVRGHGGVFPRFTVSDMGTFGGVDAGGDPALTGTMSSGITRVSQRHTLKAGYEFRLYTHNTENTLAAAGNYSFSRAYTQGPNPLQTSTSAGYGTASFLLGYGDGYAGYTTDNTRSMRYHAMFLQDDWKVTSKLTLNLGLRWEYEAPMTDRYNAFSNFDLSIVSPLRVPGLTLRGGLTYPGVGGVDRRITEPSFNDLGPRFGFAYQANRKLVARGGYGIMWIPTNGVDPTSQGFTTYTYMTGTLDGGLTPHDTLSNPFPNGISFPTGSTLGALTGVGTSVSGQLRDAQRGYVQQWNVTLQYEPFSNWLVEAGWVGNHGSRLLMLTRGVSFLSHDDLAMGSALSQLVPNPFSGILTTGSLSGQTVPRYQLLLPYSQFTGVSGGYSFLGNSIYHALALKVEKRFGRGFSTLVAYTASKLIDDGQQSSAIRVGATTVTTVQDWNNLRAERSRSAQDMPQRLVLTALWELPFGRQGCALRRYTLGGWQLNAVTTIESGRPISLSASGTLVGNRPNVVSGAKAVLDQPTLVKWFNTDAFSLLAPYTYGNVSRTLPDVNSDGMFNMDLSVFRTFTVRERYRIQFRAEAFNFTNTPTFDTPGTGIGSATFGVVTATAINPQPRVIQFSLGARF